MQSATPTRVEARVEHMILVLLVFLGGVLTILSPCILPVLPFVFARSEQKFLTSGLPMLIGMAVTFAGIATLAAVGGAWAVRVNQYGRLLRWYCSRRSRRPCCRGAWQTAGAAFRCAGKSLDNANLDVATSTPTVAGRRQRRPHLFAAARRCNRSFVGALRRPHSRVGAHRRGDLWTQSHTTLLLFSYAAGAAASLAVAILAGGRVFAALKKSLGAGEWVRRGLGVAVLSPSQPLP